MHRTSLLGTRVPTNELTDRERYSTQKNLTPEQLKAARENFAFGAKRYPEEHRVVAERIGERGLGDHREVLEYYSRHKMPISTRQLGAIETFRETSSVGAFAKGKAGPMYPSLEKGDGK